MPAIKCDRCGLVNFADARVCKRCQKALGSSAEQRADYTSPPPPPVFHDNQRAVGAPPDVYSRQKTSCVKCGTGSGVSDQDFKKAFIPPLVYGAAIAPLLLLILIGIFKVTHVVRAPFCEPCWEKFNTSKWILWGGGATAMLGAFGSIFAFIFFDSIVAFMAVMVGSFAAYLGAYVYNESSAPKFKKIDSKVVVIDTPTMGEINYSVG